MLDVLNLQAYGLSSTGRMLQIPKSTIHRWASGWVSKSGKRQAPMLKPVAGRLSFQDLAELSVVQQLRVKNVPVWKIQEAAAAIRSISGRERPFLQGVLVDPNMRELFFDHLGKLYSTSPAGQAAMREVVRPDMIRADRVSIENGVALRVFPFSRAAPEEDPKLIAIDPRYRFGKPVTSPSMIDLDGLVLRLCWRESFEEMADELRPKEGIKELEEGVRYWFSTMTTGMSSRVADVQHPRVVAFRSGESVESIAARDRVKEMTVVKHLSKALETAIAA